MSSDKESVAESVRVVCRFRPPVVKKETKDPSQRAGSGKKPSSASLSADDSASSAFLKFGDDGRTIDCKAVAGSGGTLKSNPFTFDRVFGPKSTQDELFEAIAAGTVADVLKGYNGTIFAYGQTGSGKSHTMFGPKDSPPSMRGVIPRSAHALFDGIADASDVDEVTIKCSFLEIYKEAIRDLLDPRVQGLKIREQANGEVYVQNLTEEYVSSAQDIIDLVALGEKSRMVAGTDMNEVSSRSHAVFIVVVTQKLKDGAVRVGKLNLADLAGSERIEKTGATGQTLEEAKKINQSLSALGNCINALTDNKRSHIPFRDSTLTFLLKDSLGGNCKTTLMIACSSELAHAPETLSTLKFAQRAKSIKNNAKVNARLSVEQLTALLDACRRELALSQREVKRLQHELAGGKPYTVPAAAAAPSTSATPAPPPVAVPPPVETKEPIAAPTPTPASVAIIPSNEAAPIIVSATSTPATLTTTVPSNGATAAVPAPATRRIIISRSEDKLALAAKRAKETVAANAAAAAAAAAATAASSTPSINVNLNDAPQPPPMSPTPLPPPPDDSSLPPPPSSPMIVKVEPAVSSSSIPPVNIPSRSSSNDSLSSSAPLSSSSSMDTLVTPLSPAAIALPLTSSSIASSSSFIASPMASNGNDSEFFEDGERKLFIRQSTVTRYETEIREANDRESIAQLDAVTKARELDELKKQLATLTMDNRRLQVQRVATDLKLEDAEKKMASFTPQQQQAGVIPPSPRTPLRNATISPDGKKEDTISLFEHHTRVDELQLANDRLNQQMTDMKATWEAYLQLVMEHQQQTNQRDQDDLDRRDAEQKRHAKIVKPMKPKQADTSSSSSSSSGGFFRNLFGRKPPATPPSAATTAPSSGGPPSLNRTKSSPFTSTASASTSTPPPRRNSIAPPGTLTPATPVTPASSSTRASISSPSSSSFDGKSVASGIIRAGALHKQPFSMSISSSWKRRWFVLRASQLDYYDLIDEYQLPLPWPPVGGPPLVEPNSLNLPSWLIWKGSLVFSSATKVTPVALKVNGGAYGLELAGLAHNTRVCQMYAASSADQSQWILAIRAAVTAIIASGAAPVAMPLVAPESLAAPRVAATNGLEEENKDKGSLAENLLKTALKKVAVDPASPVPASGGTAPAHARRSSVTFGPLQPDLRS